MKIIINNVVPRTDDQPECPILGTPYSLTVTMGRWKAEDKAVGVPMKTYMVDFTMDADIRQFSRNQLGDLARDIVYAVGADPRYQEEFLPYSNRVGHFHMDFFPRLFAEGAEKTASWNWGNKWTLMGAMGPTYYESVGKQVLVEDQLHRPSHFTLDELSVALQCTREFLTCYVHGQLRGHMEWDQLDALHEKIQKAFPRMVKANELLAAAAFHPQSEWQADVAKGDTKLGYEDWLRHQLNTTAEETEAAE